MTLEARSGCQIPLELELLVVVSCHVGFWEPSVGPLQEQQALLAVGPSLHSWDKLLDLTQS